mgnify:CR=1 FL=1
MEHTEYKNRIITTKELVILAFLGAILLVSQIALAPLPNIEIISLLIYIYTQIYGKKVFLPIYTFAFLEGCVYGFGAWWFGYLYVWSILAIIVLLFKDETLKESLPFSCVILGAYGLSYGFLFAIPYFIVLGTKSGMAYWVSGIPFDLVHAAGNVAVTLILYKPLRHLIEKLNRSICNYSAMR